MRLAILAGAGLTLALITITVPLQGLPFALARLLWFAWIIAAGMLWQHRGAWSAAAVAAACLMARLYWMDATAAPALSGVLLDFGWLLLGAWLAGRAFTPAAPVSVSLGAGGDRLQWSWQYDGKAPAATIEPKSEAEHYLDAARELLNRIEAPLRDMHAQADRLAGACTGDAAESMAAIDRSYRAIGDGIDRFRDYTAPVRVTRKPLSLNEAVAACMENLRRNLPDLRVTLETDTQPVIAAVHPETLERLLLPVLENAIQATAELPQGRVTVSTFRNANKCGIAVRDNGPGIPAHLVDRLFDPYVSTRAGADGLGLPTVLRVARALGAAVTVNNETAGGACVKIVLPRAIEARAAAGTGTPTHAG